MAWNYRVIEKENKNEKYYEVHEVYYDEKGNMIAHSEEAITPYGTNPKELKETLEMISLSLEKPILKLDENKNLIEI